LIPISALEASSEPSNHHLKPVKMIREVSACFCRGARKLLANHSKSSNVDCSVQNKSRELKLVPLEPAKNEDSEYVLKKIILACLCNEAAIQNIWQHHFPEPGGKGHCGTNWLIEVVEIATFFEFDEINRFFTTSCDPYTGHTLRLFYTFHHKKDTKDG
jgi:hypothetical protein